jgi:drug/metabolite transporter (DMT)-like permease
MSRAYPLMRGLAPVLVALAGASFLGERLGPAAWTGVALVSAGVFGMTFAAGGPASRAGTLLALLNAGVIASYTLIDGAGVRVSGAPVAYAMWLFLVTAVPLVTWAALARGRALLAYAGRNWRLGLAGGVGNLGSYGLALWAMTQAPVAVVAALRETSIIFGMAIAGLLLRERIGPARLAAAGLIVAGAINLRLA